MKVKVVKKKDDSWQKYGVAFLYIEMAIAIGVSIFALVETLIK